MKTKLSILLVMAVLALSVIPVVFATDVGTGVGVTVNTEQFKPMLFMCDNRSVQDDNQQNGANNLSLSERKNNYAFEGESIHWTVLAVDKNKIEAITDVVGTAGPTQGVGNDVQVECDRISGNIATGEGSQNTGSALPASCGAKILEENLSWNPDIMAFYDCRLTVETPESMHGEYFLTVEAQTANAGSTIMHENEFWFLNPTIALSTDGTLTFDNVRPGTNSYSDTMLVRNDAEAGSGVMLDMFVSGTDFYDSSSSGAFCPTTNQLALTNFRYFVTNGAYSSADAVVKAAGETDAQGYTSIPPSTDISGAERIMRYNTAKRGASPSSSVVETDWNNGNALTPGAEMALTFKLAMPEPCTGNFDSGQIFFWGEAI